MKRFMHRAAMVCAAFVFAILGSPLAAQQTALDQTLPPPPQQQSPPSIPPAPPPDVRDSALPPFPPMSARPPRHRWVNTGEHRSSSSRHKVSTRSSRGHHANAAMRHSTKARQRPKQRSAMKALSKSELRRCKNLSHRQLLKSRKCREALRTDHKATARRHNGVKALSKAELRRCHNMSYRQLLRNRNCAALLQSELKAADGNHRSRSHKASARERKTKRRASQRHRR